MGVRTLFDACATADNGWVGGVGGSVSQMEDGWLGRRGRGIDRAWSLSWLDDRVGVCT